MQLRRVRLASLALVVATTGYACGSKSGAKSSGSESTSSSGSGTGSGANGGGISSAGTASGLGGGLGSGGGDGGLFTNHGAVVSIAISPATATINVQNGMSSPQAFTAIATYADKTTAPVSATWSFDQLPLAQVDVNGNLQASGTLGGHGTVTAAASGVQATAGVDVILHVVQNPAMLTTAQQGSFGSPTAAPSGTLLYPYDQTVFPRGLLPPELQWSGGAAGDVYLVHVAEKYYDGQFFVSADPPSRFTLPVDAWTQLTQSNGGDQATLDIQRLSAGVAYQSMHEAWTIAQGSLRGSIYYWAVNQGQLMKIAPGTATPTVIFDSGPAASLGTPTPTGYDGTMPPWASGNGTNRCVACHTVSKDGSTLAAIFEKTGSTASPWGTVDLTQPTPPITQITPYTSTTIFLGLTPDGTYAVANDTTMTLALANAKTGAAIPSALDAFTDHTCDPAFSPDGTHLAFSSNVQGYYPVEFTQGDLDVIDFDPTMVAFTNRRTIAMGGGEAIAFPSFTPDSAWAIFQKGDYSRAKYGTSSVGHDDLYMTDLAMQVGTLSLATASGASLDPTNQHLAYQPTVNPIAVGGYVWVVFVSPRDYGNEMASTTGNPTYDNRKQLWVAAVDVNPKAGTDPSHPAFWLPGQDITTINMSGYWALEACQQVGNSCDQGYECCTGFCQADGDGGLSCSPPPSGCSAVGNKCTTSSDCCNSPTVTCIGGFCSQANPQ